MSVSMFRKLVLLLGLLSLSACGGALIAPPIPTPVIINGTNVPPAPIPMNTFVVVQRGFYAGCNGHIVNVITRPFYGNYYTISPLYCAFTNTIFYDVTLHWSYF